MPLKVITKLSVVPLTVLLALNSSQVLAHTEFVLPEGTQADASLYTSYTSKGVSDKEIWQIPGLLMGGDASGSEQGFALNDASILLQHVTDEDLFVVFEAGTHGHGDDHELSLEQAIGGYQWTSSKARLKFEAGHLKATFSPNLEQHPHQRSFTEVPLAYQGFLGAHYSEPGARIQSLFELSSENSLIIGTTIWEGDAFPGNALEQDPAYSVFSKFAHHGESLITSVGLWHFRSESEQRLDERHESGHSHSGSTPSDISFSGESELSGVHMSVRWHSDEQRYYEMTGGYLHNRVDGHVRDTTRQASLQGRYHAPWIQVGYRYGKYKLSLRHEEMKLDNELKGPGAQALGLDAGLDEMASNPTRTSFAYQKEVLDGLLLRAEVIDDRTTENPFYSSRLSASWSHSFLD